MKGDDWNYITRVVDAAEQRGVLKRHRGTNPTQGEAIVCTLHSGIVLSFRFFDGRLMNVIADKQTSGRDRCHDA